jgi:hypothetical protein
MELGTRQVARRGVSSQARDESEKRQVWRGRDLNLELRLQRRTHAIQHAFGHAAGEQFGDR